MQISIWNIESLTGYKPITTFYEDFSIADQYGFKAIEDTYRRAFRNWKDDYKYLTELVMVLNWKIWAWYEKDYDIAKLYDGLWRKTQDYALKHLDGEELSYFLRTTD